MDSHIIFKSLQADYVLFHLLFLNKLKYFHFHDIFLHVSKNFRTSFVSTLYLYSTSICTSNFSLQTTQSLHQKNGSTAITQLHYLLPVSNYVSSYKRRTTLRILSAMIQTQEYNAHFALVIRVDLSHGIFPSCYGE